jgi:hypothetical protein
MDLSIENKPAGKTPQSIFIPTMAARVDARNPDQNQLIDEKSDIEISPERLSLVGFSHRQGCCEVVTRCLRNRG